MLATGELAVRLLGDFDVDGNFMIGKRTLRPYQLPLESTRQNLEKLLQENSAGRMKYDPVLGWSVVPKSGSEDGFYRYNSQGARVADQEIVFDTLPNKDTFRIVLIGDSFTHGDEVIYEDTWAFLLEQQLNSHGFPAQVINLGVSGFGMDQAFWRWEISGKSFWPDLVIFGLQMENVRRNVNLIRPIYTPHASIVLSKPRYVLSGDSLQLINRPTVAPDSLLAVLANFEKWELATYEYFYRPADYRSSFFFKSKFIAFLREHIQPDRSLTLRHPYGTRTAVYPLGEEPAEVAIKILEKMEQEISYAGQDLLVVHLPHIWGLGYFRKYNTIPYDELLQTIAGKVELLDTKTAFAGAFATNKNDDFYLNFHYAKLGNEIVATNLAAFILKKYAKQ